MATSIIIFSSVCWLFTADTVAFNQTIAICLYINFMYINVHKLNVYIILLQHLSEEMMQFSDQLTELQKLSHRLLEVDSASTTEYLEHTMRDLQERWDMFEEK